MEAAALIVLAYVLGGVPFGYLFARARGIDIFRVGSGNIGATNVERALGKKVGAAVLLLDVLKGLLPALAGWHLVHAPAWLGGQQQLAVAAGTAAVVGHCFSPFLRFKGGKGVSSGIGCLIGAAWPIAIVVFATFVVVFALSRYVSLSSIMGAVAIIPAAVALRYEPLSLAVLVTLALLVIVRHQANIRRLFSGTENRFGSKPKEPPSVEASALERT